MNNTIPAGPIPPPPGTKHLAVLDMRWVSRYSRPTFRLEIYVGNGLKDADDDVTATLYGLSDAATVINPPQWTRIADHPSTGIYTITMTSVDTKDMGNYELQFTYTLDGNDEIAVFDFEIGPPAPEYDALPDRWRAVVDAVWRRFEDLYDSPYGGPNLQVYIQTKFGRNRLAQLMSTAISTLNTATLGHSMHAVGSQSFDFANWSGLLETSLYVEVLKHLHRSYVEQPEVLLGTTVSRLDRRDYMQRWAEVLQTELAPFERDLGRYKMANMGLGNVHVLVSGGAFGKLGPYVNAGGAGEAAARGYFAVRRWH